MRIEIGVDIIENNRFDDDILSDSQFMDRYFSKRELDYCFSQHSPREHFAARFAGKEAVVKALYGFGIKCRIENIEIVKSSDDTPKVCLHGLDIDFAKYGVKISLAHTENTSIAFATIYCL